MVHLKRSLPHGSTWSAAGIGSAQLAMNTYAIKMGGHACVGLEDCIYHMRGELATNEGMLARIVRLNREFGREIVTPDKARKILQISPSPPFLTTCFLR